MAIAVVINFSMVDGDGKPTGTKIRVPTGFAISDYREFAEEAAQILVDISNCQITSASIGVEVDLSGLGLKTVASAVEKVGAKMQGLFATASGLIAKWLIPAPLEEKVVSGSDDFDQTDTDVAAWIAANEDGLAVTGGTWLPCNGRGDDITGINTCKETFLARRAS